MSDIQTLLHAGHTIQTRLRGLRIEASCSIPIDEQGVRVLEVRLLGSTFTLVPEVGSVPADKNGPAADVDGYTILSYDGKGEPVPLGWVETAENAVTPILAHLVRSYVKP